MAPVDGWGEGPTNEGPISLMADKFERFTTMLGRLTKRPADKLPTVKGNGFSGRGIGSGFYVCSELRV